MGSGSGPIGYGNRIDRRFTHDEATAGRAELGLRRLLPGLARRGSSARGAARSTCRPTTCRSWERPAAASTSPPATRATASGRRYLAGQALGSLATERDDEWSTLPLVRGRGDRVPREPLRYIGGAAIRKAILACEEADEAGRRAPLLARGAAALPALLGMRLGTR